MLTPSPDAMRTLLARYNDLQLRHSQDSDYELQRSLEDVTYTLCVSTGTRTVHDALLAADTILRKAAAGREEAVAGIPIQRMVPPGVSLPKPRTA
ncbi:DUF5133 domain-containing protein [Streptomyces sp. MBT55]|uniref:DUF5133 domain-containing protein n=1 Tax=Streptomyces sp. MBT55 TaxID=1488386 RepID=UPI00191377A6|nr:DUF5133 domain-containing protein [Streptomyces sp. MBT55]MBK6047484.1 DUF5133 domain-containing protein [Streptomyces sp. MBT55]